MAALVKLVNRLSPPLRDTLENAVGEAMKRKASTVETAHWLYHIIFGKNVVFVPRCLVKVVQDDISVKSGPI